jgi:hypothetical protein
MKRPSTGAFNLRRAAARRRVASPIQRTPKKTEKLNAFFKEDARVSVAKEICTIVGGVIVVISAVALLYDFWHRAEERKVWRDTRIATEWQNLLRPVGGNTGKGDALNFLLSEGVNLADVDLSCRAVGEWDGTCTRPAVFAGVDFSVLDLEAVGAMNRVSFEGNAIDAPRFPARAEAVEDLRINNVIASGWEEFTPPPHIRLHSCTDCDVRGWFISERFLRRLTRSNLSGTQVVVASQKLLTTNSIEQNRPFRNFAFVEQPPIVLRKGESVTSGNENQPILAKLELEALDWCRRGPDAARICGLSYAEARTLFPANYAATVDDALYRISPDGRAAAWSTFNPALVGGTPSNYIPDCESITSAQQAELAQRGLMCR